MTYEELLEENRKLRWHPEHSTEPPVSINDRLFAENCHLVDRIDELKRAQDR